jgi:hypothetical protein
MDGRERKTMDLQPLLQRLAREIRRFREGQMTLDQAGAIADAAEAMLVGLAQSEAEIARLVDEHLYGKAGLVK